MSYSLCLIAKGNLHCLQLSIEQQPPKGRKSFKVIHYNLLQAVYAQNWSWKYVLALVGEISMWASHKTKRNTSMPLCDYKSKRLSRDVNHR
jgi:hypothetical protein